jgi:hypothetical protein
MKASTLRIGNYIIHEPTIDDWEQKTVKAGTIIQCEISPDSFEPIPLTEEWLIKFGFEKVIYESDETGYGTDYELDIKGVGCISYSDDFSCALFGSKESSKHELGFLPNWDNCKHVHSLQNLYFALVGEELKIKE